MSKHKPCPERTYNAEEAIELIKQLRTCVRHALDCDIVPDPDEKRESRMDTYARVLTRADNFLHRYGERKDGEAGK